MNIRYCNICGSKMDFWDIQEDYTIHTTAGYGSKYDEEEIEIHICCDCMDRLIDRCAISPVASRSCHYKLVEDKRVQEEEESGFLE